MSLFRCCRRCSYSLTTKWRTKIKIEKRDLKIFVPCFLSLFATAYSLTLLFPFLPFMIEFLLPGVEEEDIGKYAGFIASSLFLGRFFGSYVWGAFADKKGRKPIVIVSLVLMGLFTIAFGLSVKLYMAIVFRFLVGLGNGAVGTIKAIISESSTNRTQALSMSLITCAFSLGLVVGPAVSGALADPIGQYNLTISNPVVRGFFTKFPFSLPCFANSLMCIIAAVTVAIWMPETLRAKTSKKNPASGDISSHSSSVSDDKQELLPNSANSVHELQNISTTESNTDLRAADKKDNTEHSQRKDELEDADESIERATNQPTRKQSSINRRGSFLIPFFNRRASFTPSFFKSSRRDLLANGRQQRLVFEEDTSEALSLPVQEEVEMEGGGEVAREAGEVTAVSHERSITVRAAEGLKKILRNLKLFLTTRATLLALLIYCIFSFAIIGFDEVYSLWAASAPHLGGLGWTLHEIGISLAVCGILFLPFTFLFPVLERRFGLVTVYQMNLIAVIVCVLALPSAHFVSPDTLNPLRWFLVIFLLVIIRATIGNVIVACALFINNSVTFDKLGEVNGLAHSLTSMVRTASPIFCASIFSVSLSKGARTFGFPIDYHLIFIILGVILLVCTVLAACLPPSINRQKAITSDSDSINRSKASSPDRIDEDSIDGSTSPK